jgi:hypothetical protein
MSDLMLKFFREVAKHVCISTGRKTVSNNSRLKQLLDVELYYIFWPCVDIIMFIIMYTTKNSFMQTLNLNSNRETPLSECTDRRAVFS